MTGRLATPSGIMHGVATVSWQSQLFLPSGRRLTSSGKMLPFKKDYFRGHRTNEISQAKIWPLHEEVKRNPDKKVNT